MNRLFDMKRDWKANLKSILRKATIQIYFFFEVIILHCNQNSATRFPRTRHHGCFYNFLFGIVCRRTNELCLVYIICSRHETIWEWFRQISDDTSYQNTLNFNSFVYYWLNGIDMINIINNKILGPITHKFYVYIWSRYLWQHHFIFCHKLLDNEFIYIFEI